MQFESPAQFSWSDSFLLGFQKMDDTHKEFVDIVARMLVARHSELLELIDEFIRHAVIHFEEEASWMEGTSFPARQCHIDEHNAVMKSVNEVRSLVLAGNEQIGYELAKELAAWFPAHADYLDSALAQWMVKQDFGGIPLVFKRNTRQMK